MVKNVIIRSGYLVDSSGGIIENPSVSISDGRVSSLVDTRNLADRDDCLDLGKYSAIIPGLVNAHTHLELTLARDCERRPRRFTDWLRNIIRLLNEWSPECFGESLEEGIRQSLRAGVTAVGDISGRADCTVYSRHPLSARIFHEVIGFDPLSADNTASSLSERLAKQPHEKHLLAGISPHTPYTVSEKLLRRCGEISVSEDIPLSIHLAETLEECEFLRHGSGEILDFRKEFGMPNGWRPPQKSPVQYLRDIGLLNARATLIHCNYVDEADLNLIAASSCPVVYCPRSHLFFRHRRYPLEQMLEKGITVALGTDSLASSPSLSILEEMQTVRALYPEVAPAEILRMGTANGRRALALEEGMPALQIGSVATLTGILFPPDVMDGVEDPLEAVLSQEAKAVLSVTEGKILFSADSETCTSRKR